MVEESSEDGTDITEALTPKAADQVPSISNIPRPSFQSGSQSGEQSRVQSRVQSREASPVLAHHRHPPPVFSHEQAKGQSPITSRDSNSDIDSRMVTPKGGMGSIFDVHPLHLFF